MALYLVLGTEGSPAAAGDRYPATDAGILFFIFYNFSPKNEQKQSGIYDLIDVYELEIWPNL